MYTHFHSQYDMISYRWSMVYESRLLQAQIKRLIYNVVTLYAVEKKGSFENRQGKN
jgi:hypothetical protein